MDEFFKRLVVAYFGFTAALWAISGGMYLNGAALPKNPAWVIVSNLRLLFTAPIVLALVLAASACLVYALIEARVRRQEALAARARAEREKREIEERRRKAVEEERLEAEREAARLAREEEKKAKAERQEEERQKQKAIEKQARSAKRAAERALDDF